MSLFNWVKILNKTVQIWLIKGINRLDGIIGTVNQGNLLADEINLELDK